MVPTTVHRSFGPFDPPPQRHLGRVSRLLNNRGSSKGGEAGSHALPPSQRSGLSNEIFGKLRWKFIDMSVYVKNCIFRHMTDKFFSGDHPPLRDPCLPKVEVLEPPLLNSRPLYGRYQRTDRRTDKTTTELVHSVRHSLMIIYRCVIGPVAGVCMRPSERMQDTTTPAFLRVSSNSNHHS